MRRVSSAGAIKQMFRKEEYQVRDLFYTSWADLSGRQQAEAYTLWLRMKSLNTPEGEPLPTEYGFLLIAIMRVLRKNPALVDRINEAQLVDAFNEIKGFLDAPWFEFKCKVNTFHLHTPDEKMARTTFDHFIYADNEFSSFLINQNQKHLVRLVATLYQKNFDKENVTELAADLKLKEWELMHTFYTYKHIREFIVKRCKTLMPEAVAHEEDAPVKQVPTGSMWLKLKNRLSETPAFATFEQASKANVYDALDYLEDLAQIKERSKLNA
jgi:hypothetical protein